MKHPENLIFRLTHDILVFGFVQNFLAAILLNKVSDKNNYLHIKSISSNLSHALLSKSFFLFFYSFSLIHSAILKVKSKSYLIKCERVGDSCERCGEFYELYGESYEVCGALL